jgi:hypothetical protein
MGFNCYKYVGVGPKQLSPTSKRAAQLRRKLLFRAKSADPELVEPKDSPAGLVPERNPKSLVRAKLRGRSGLYSCLAKTTN